MVSMLLKWPQLRRKRKVKRDTDEEADEEAEWDFQPDKVTKRDFMRLGKGFGTMLSKKNYRWVTYSKELLDLLDTMFPAVATDTRGHHREGIRFIVQNAKQVRQQYDELHLQYVQT